MMMDANRYVIFHKNMAIEINSFEYQCWHEVGHAITCLIKGGSVEFIAFSDDESQKGLARTRCETTACIRPYVLCGGFATEFVLYKDGLLSEIDDKEFTQIIFKNATIDREMYFGTTKGQEFTKDADTRFMHFAVDNVAPIIRDNIESMKKIVSKLKDSGGIGGKEITKLLNEK